MKIALQFPLGLLFGWIFTGHVFRCFRGVSNYSRLESTIGSRGRSRLSGNTLDENVDSIGGMHFRVNRTFHFGVAAKRKRTQGLQHEDGGASLKIISNATELAANEAAGIRMNLNAMTKFDNPQGIRLSPKTEVRIPTIVNVMSRAGRHRVAHSQIEDGSQERVSAMVKLERWLPYPISFPDHRQLSSAAFAVQLSFLSILSMGLAFGVYMTRSRRSRSKFEPDDDTFSESSESYDEDTATKPCKLQTTAKSLGQLFWAPPKQAAALVAKPEGSPEFHVVEAPWTVPAVKRVLSDYAVLEWPDEALKEFARELATGKVRLFQKCGALFRVLDVVIVILVHEKDGLVIQELSHPAYRRNFEDIPERSPKARMRYNESLTDCTRRCLREKLNMPDWMCAGEQKLLNLRQKIEYSPQLPGLTSVVRHYVVQVALPSNTSECLAQVGIPERRLQAGDCRYIWMEIKEVQNLRKHLARNPRSKINTMDCVVLDGTAEPVLAWTEHDIVGVIRDAGVGHLDEAVQWWGRDLETVLQLLNRGLVSLAKSSAGDKIFCVTNVLTLYVTAANGDVLLQHIPKSLASSSGGPFTMARSSCLPFATQFTNESVWAAAFRLAHLKLGIVSPTFRLSDVLPIPARINTELDHAKGWITREFLVHAALDEAGHFDVARGEIDNIEAAPAISKALLTPQVWISTTIPNGNKR